MQKNVAYKGLKFTIEWYFDAKGVSDSLEYFLKLSDVQKEKLLHLFKLMGDFGRNRSFVMKVIKFLLSSQYQIDFYVSFLPVQKLL